jgi:hypothetical protein
VQRIGVAPARLGEFPGGAWPGSEMIGQAQFGRDVDRLCDAVPVEQAVELGGGVHEQS